MQCFVLGLRMKFSSLLEMDAWVTMLLHSSRKKLAIKIYFCFLQQIEFCLTAFILF